MVVVVKNDTDQERLKDLITWLKQFGVQIHITRGTQTSILGLVGDTSSIDMSDVQSFDIVEDIKRIQEPYKAANRKFHPHDTVVEVGGLKIGGGNFQVIAGPCSVETEDQICEVAKRVQKAGATMIRGGAFKPRTSPYSFQGLRATGIELLKEAKALTGMPIVTEIMSIEHLPLFEDVDVIQVGARNMQNFELLKEVGRRTSKPILLKRGFSNTIDEWIMSAEYIMANGNPNVIFCERGIRTFETETRNTLDLSVIPIIKEKTHLPIIIDPSHATGDWKLVEAASLAAIAAGADGLIIEVHDNPECALSDGAQCLKPKKFKQLVDKARKIANVLGRDI